MLGAMRGQCIAIKARQTILIRARKDNYNCKDNYDYTHPSCSQPHVGTSERCGVIHPSVARVEEGRINLCCAVLQVCCAVLQVCCRCR